jgi:hypothetical protein
LLIFAVPLALHDLIQDVLALMAQRGSGGNHKFSSLSHLRSSEYASSSFGYGHSGITTPESVEEGSALLQPNASTKKYGHVSVLSGDWRAMAQAGQYSASRSSNGSNGGGGDVFRVPTTRLRNKKLS